MLQWRDDNLTALRSLKALLHVVVRALHGVESLESAEGGRLVRMRAVLQGFEGDVILDLALAQNLKPNVMRATAFPHRFHLRRRVTGCEAIAVGEDQHVAWTFAKPGNEMLIASYASAGDNVQGGDSTMLTVRIAA